MSGSYLSIKQLTDSFENKVVKKKKRKLWTLTPEKYYIPNFSYILEGSQALSILRKGYKVTSKLLLKHFHANIYPTLFLF